MKRNQSLAFLFVLMLSMVILVTGCSAASQESSQSDASNESSGGDFASLNQGSSLHDLAAGLSGLSGYLATLTLEFEGKLNGEPLTWSRTYQLRVSRSGKGFRQLEQQTVSPNPSGNPTSRLITDFGNYQYQKIGQQACTAVAKSESIPLSELWELAGWLPAVYGGQAAGQETIEGTLARRYTFDERSLGQVELTDSSGEVWVAADSGVVLRYSLVQTAAEDYFGEGIQGTLIWKYHLSEINQPQSLSLPDDCQPPIAMLIPLPADASNVDRSENFLEYTTSLEDAEVLNFHREYLEAEGWQLVEDSGSSEFGNFGFDLGGFDLGEFEEEGEEFDWSEEDLESDMDDSLSDNSPVKTYLFKRGNEKLTWMVTSEGNTRSVTMYRTLLGETASD